VNENLYPILIVKVITLSVHHWFEYTYEWWRG